MSGDNFIYNTASSSNDKFKGVYNSKDYFWVGDNQNGVYRDTLTFSLNSFFSESDKFMSLSEAFLAIPMVSVVSKSGGNTPLRRNDFAVAMKNSYLNLIDNFSLDVDGKTKCQSNSFINLPCIFKQITSMSESEMRTNSVGFFMDTADSWHYNGGSAPVQTNGTTTNPIQLANTVFGNGVINNIVTPSFDSRTAGENGSLYNTGSSFNSGLVRRMKGMNLSPTLNTNNAPNTVYTQNAGALRTEASYKDELKPYTVYNGVGNDTSSQAFYFVAIIKLKDLTDLFAVDALSLVKAVNINLNIKLNTGICQIERNNATADGDNVWRIYHAGQSASTFTNTNPMLCLAHTYPVFQAGVNTTFTFGLYIQKVTNLGLGTQASLGIESHIMPSARLYAPLVTLQPQLSSLYLSNNQAKLIKYSDVYSQQLLNVQAGAQVNWTVNNGLSNGRLLVVIPFISSQVNGVVPGTINTVAGLLSNGFSPMISPFTTEPSSSSPLLQLADFGCSIGGKELLQSKLKYSWEQFIQQMGVNKINGGNHPVLNGLLSQSDWESSYRYYVVDLSRGVDSDDDTPKDIRVSCRNDNRVAVDLYCFVLQTKKFVINVSTGRISDNIASSASLE